MAGSVPNRQVPPSGDHDLSFPGGAGATPARAPAAGAAYGAGAGAGAAAGGLSGVSRAEAM
jgi:hypothetical protein